jgi:hypothetical protein
MIRTCFCIFLLVVLNVSSVPGLADMRVLTLLEAESFWGGCVTDGRSMPFGAADFERDLYGDTRGNQAQPLLISDRGRYVWCVEPFKFTFKDGTLTVESRAGDIKTGKPGDTLRECPKAEICRLSVTHFTRLHMRRYCHTFKTKRFTSTRFLPGDSRDDCDK